MINRDIVIVVDSELKKKVIGFTFKWCKIYYMLYKLYSVSVLVANSYTNIH